MKLTPTETAVAVWAAAQHHMGGGADGHPKYREVLQEPARATARSRATRSDMTYDATKDKYDLRKAMKFDVRVLAAVEAVERALRAAAAPEWFRRYLVFKHPEFGRYEPKREVREEVDPEDYARAFVESGHLHNVIGGLKSKRVRATAVKTVLASEREFNALLARELRNLPKRARRARGARSGSRARRETA